MKFGRNPWQEQQGVTKVMAKTIEGLARIVKAVIDTGTLAVDHHHPGGSWALRRGHRRRVP